MIGKPNLTWKESVATLFLVGSVGWCSATFMRMYGDTAAVREINAMRDREVDDLKNRLMRLEAPCPH